MDQHPIPQDVTGFQFKLIGTMTVKQFGYVATGVVFAVIVYYLKIESPIAPIIKLILVPILGAGGVIIAFVPIDGRPVDLMATNFVKALFSPNQYIYHRHGKKLSFSRIADAKATSAPKIEQTPLNKSAASAQQSVEKEEKLRLLLMSSGNRVKNDLDKKESAFLNTLGLPTIKPSTPVSTPANPITPIRPNLSQPIIIKPPVIVPSPQAAIQQPLPQPPISPMNNNESLDNKELQLEQELAQAKKEETIAGSPVEVHQRVDSLEKQIQQIHVQKQQLELELTKLHSQLSEQKSPINQPTIQSAPVDSAPKPTPIVQTPPPLVQDPQHVRNIPQNVTKMAGLPHVSDTPNVVVGIVKDPRGNVLSNILVEVKDKESNPVRAFKTNALGQFASATPLSVGTYTMELEDPKKLHRFDVIQIIANNQIMLPIEVISHDAREELRQQLFSQ